MGSGNEMKNIARKHGGMGAELRVFWKVMATLIIKGGIQLSGIPCKKGRNWQGTQGIKASQKH